MLKFSFISLCWLLLLEGPCLFQINLQSFWHIVLVEFFHWLSEPWDLLGRKFGLPFIFVYYWHRGGILSGPHPTNPHRAAFKEMSTHGSPISSLVACTVTAGGKNLKLTLREMMWLEHLGFAWRRAQIQSLVSPVKNDQVISDETLESCCHSE